MKSALALVVYLSFIWHCMCFIVRQNAIVRLASKLKDSNAITSNPYYTEVKRQSEKFFREEYWCSRSMEKIKDMTLNAYFKSHHYNVDDVLVVEELLEALLSHMDDLKRERIFKQEEIALYPEHEILRMWGSEYEQQATYKADWDPNYLNLFVTRLKVYVDFFAFEEVRRVIGGGSAAYLAAFADRIMKQFRNPVQKESKVSYKSESDFNKITVSVLSPDKSRMVKLEIVAMRQVNLRPPIEGIPELVEGSRVEDGSLYSYD